ncbi:MAG: MOSC domain-containing protein [Planctomycetota bacterium]
MQTTGETGDGDATPAAYLHSIWTADAAGEPLSQRGAVRALVGAGLEGDRYARGAGTFRPGRGVGSREVSLVALATVEEVARELGRALEPGALRRNLVVAGLELMELVGAELSIGGVRLRCTATCPPCGRLERLVGAPVRDLLRGRGGLRAEVVEGGELVAGTAIEVVSPPRGLP